MSAANTLSGVFNYVHLTKASSVFKGNQKGKVTCYARERVNKDELF